MSEESTSNAWREKWTSPLRTAASTTAGMCVNTTTTLDRIIAGMNRDIVRTKRNSQRGDNSQRASHAGVPSKNNGATISEKVRCCTMCTENR